MVNHGGQEIPAYGLWKLVFINSAIFIFFAFTFFKPKTQRDWRTLGSFSAFIVALFAEMYVCAVDGKEPRDRSGRSPGREREGRR
jgi:hypothetical protein